MPFSTYQLNEHHRFQDKITEWHREQMHVVMKEVLEMLSAKSRHYDNLRPFIERLPFGDESWATMLFIKADRLCSTIAGELSDADIDECVRDLLVYTVAYRAWRRMRQQEEGGGGRSRDITERVQGIRPEPSISNAVDSSGTNGPRIR